MRVLHFIPSFGSGGAERQLSLIGPALQARGLDVHIAHCHQGPHHQRVADSRVHLHPLRATNSHDLRLLWQAASLIRAVQPDIVHTWLLQMDVFGGLAARLLGKPLVLSERSSQGAYPAHWKHRLRIWIGRHADAIVANSEGGLDYWRDHGAPEQALRLIRNCVVPAPPLVDEASPLPAGEMVLFAGRLSPEKNVTELLEALLLVAARRPAVVIKMFGEGPLRDTLARRLAESGMSARIDLMGFSSQIADWMRVASLCVSVSDFEGHPNVVLEAASLGCPLVLSDIPAHREVLGDAAALFVRGRSAPGIAEAILRALDDPAGARLRAGRALQAVSAFTLESVAQGYMDTYAEVLETASPRPYQNTARSDS